MKLLATMYAIFLILFFLEMTALTLASPHGVDRSWMIVNIASIVVFSLTAIFSFKYFFSAPNGYVLLFLFMTLVIFAYYTYDVFSTGVPNDVLAYQPLVGLLVGLFLFYKISVEKVRALEKKKSI